MAIVTLRGASTISPLIPERHLQEVPEAELVALLIESLGEKKARSLTQALLVKLGEQMLTRSSALRLYCQWKAPAEDQSA